MRHSAQVHLAPAHPCMGWVSMNRYWQALVTESKSDAGVRSLFPAGPVETPAKSRWQRLWLRRVAYPWMIKTQVRSGVLHILDHSFADLLSSVRPAVRTVVTVHDLIPLSDPADLTSSQWMRYQKTVSWIPRADKVVCVSNHTRQEVQWLLNVSEDKLHVLPNGTSQLPFPDAVMSERLAILPPFILSVGGTRPRKNLRLLVPLTQCLAERGSRVTVVRAGPALDESLAARIREHAELHELGMVSDAELAAAYGRAALTLVPSTHEGFGLPVLEAMQAGCPVVYSQATSLPEVAGEAGLSFDPDDPTRAADLCWRVLSEPDLRQQLIKAGRARANQFTWSAHWRGLREIYDGLLNS